MANGIYTKFLGAKREVRGLLLRDQSQYSKHCKMSYQIAKP